MMKKIVCVLISLSFITVTTIQPSAFLASLRGKSKNQKQAPVAQQSSVAKKVTSTSDQPNLQAATTKKTSKAIDHKSQVSQPSTKAQAIMSGPATVLDRSSRITMSTTSQIVYLRNYTETGVAKNTFLCSSVENLDKARMGGAMGGFAGPLGAVTAIGVAAHKEGKDRVGFEAHDCSQADIDGAKGLSFAGGKTLQLFNNFSYWMRQKNKESNYATTSLRYDDKEVKSYLKQQGWGATNAYCIVISTDPILQKVVRPDLQASEGKVKVIAQLLYNGNGMIQLWSQDVVFVPIGKGFNIQVSNDIDSDLQKILAGQNYVNYLKNALKSIEDKEKASEEDKKKTSKKAVAKIEQNVFAPKRYTASIKSSNEILLRFLGSIDLVPQVRMADVYNGATDSPRKIRIQVVS